MIETMLKAAARAEAQGWTLRAVVRKPAPADHYLYCVICEKEVLGGGSMPYVCWLYNATDDAFHSGIYCDSLIRVYDELNERIERGVDALR